MSNDEFEPIISREQSKDFLKEISNRNLINESIVQSFQPQPLPNFKKSQQR